MSSIASTAEARFSPRAERGFGLVVVLFFGLLLTLLVLSIHSWSRESLRRVTSRANTLRAENAARSGLQVALSELKSDPTWAAPLSGALPSLPGVTYRVELFRGPSAPDGTAIPPGMVYLLSRGECGSQHWMAGALATRGPSLSLFDYGLFAQDGFNLSSGSRLASWGPSLPSAAPFQVGTNSTAGGVIDLSGGSQIDGPVMVGPGGGAGVLDLSGGSQVTGPVSPLAAPKTFTAFARPAVAGPVQSLDLSGGDRQALAPGNYGSLELGGGSRIDLSSGQYYVAGGLDLSGGSQLTVQNPSGPVVLLVDGGVDLSGGSALNPGGAPAGLQVIVLSGGVDLGNNSQIRGGVYAPKGAYHSGGGSRTIGSVVARSADLGGGSDVLYDHALGSSTGGAGAWRLTVVRSGL